MPQLLIFLRFLKYQWLLDFTSSGAVDSEKKEIEDWDQLSLHCPTNEALHEFPLFLDFKSEYLESQ